VELQNIICFATYSVIRLGVVITPHQYRIFLGYFLVQKEHLSLSTECVIKY